MFDCNRYFVESPNGGETWNVGTTQTIRWLGSEPADLWLSLDGGGTYDLIGHGVGGQASNTRSFLVPHAPTRFAVVKLTPVDPAITGSDLSDALFTIQSSVELFAFTVTPASEGGADLAWSTEPGVGPEGLAGYRVYRLAKGEKGNGARIGPDLIADTRYTDRQGVPGQAYRLVAVNGLMEELEVGRGALAPNAAFAAWPLPYRGGDLSIGFASFGGLGGGEGEATVDLFDASGRLVRRVVQGLFPAGYHLATWDGRDGTGKAAPNGIYFARVRSAGVDRRIKVVVTR